MAKRSGPRGRTVPVPAWWVARIRAAIPKGVTQPELARRVAPVIGWEPDESSISRCLSGKQPTLEVVVALSDLFDVPRPVVIARTEKEAVAIRGVTSLVDAQLKEVDAYVATTTAGVPASSQEDQTVPVDTEHGSRKAPRSRRKQQRGVGPSRS